MRPQFGSWPNTAAFASDDAQIDFATCLLEVHVSGANSKADANTVAA